MAEKNWRYGTEGGIVEFPFFYNLKQEGMMTARGKREKLSIFLSREGQLPMQKETARDMWQGRMAAHEGGCKAMLADGETGE